MIAAAVPLKRLTEAKSRLASRLDHGERVALVSRLLDRTVEALRESGVVGRIALVTAEAELADRMHVERLPDGEDLNAALARAMEWGAEIAAESLLLVPGDLPYVTPGDVRALVALGGDGRGIWIASTQDGGTGALLLTPPNAIPPAFGSMSFARHIDLAERHSVAVHVVHLPAFSFDLDTPADLEAIQACAIAEYPR